MGWSADGGDAHSRMEQEFESAEDDWESIPTPVDGVGIAPDASASEDFAATDGYSSNEWLVTDDQAAYDSGPETESHAAQEHAGWTPPGEPASPDSDDDVYYFETSSVQRDEPFPIEIFTSETEDEEEARATSPSDSESFEPAGRDDASQGPREGGDLLPIKSPRVPPILPRAPEADRYAASEFMDHLPEAAEEPTMAARRESDGTAFEPVGEADYASESQSAFDQPDEVDISNAAEVGSDGPLYERSHTEQPAEPFPTVPPARRASDREPEDKRVTAGPVTPRPSEGTEGLSQFADRLREQAAGPSSAPAGTDTGREGQRKPMLVCFLPVQGGSGASTVSLHVAEAISRIMSERVLVADFDFHCGTLAFRLGLRPTHTLSDVLEWKKEKHLIWETAVCRWKKLDVLVAPTTNSPVRPQSLDSLPEIFSSALRRYPYVVIDHPDAIYSSSRHILTLAGLVYLVCTPEMTALHLARRKVQQIRALGVPNERMRLIVNRASSWGSLGVEDIGRIVGVPVSWALDNDYAALRDAVWNGGLVEEGSTLAAQLRKLGRSIMGLDAEAEVETESPVGVSAPPT